MIKSHSFHRADLNSEWYKRWAKELHQDSKHLEGYALHANKFWQNAVMVQALYERGLLRKGVRGLGFGVGQERLPALFAKYGVSITATDQDFTTRKAGHWAKQELATGVQSLNKLDICDPEIFNDQVEYMSADMSDVPEKLSGSYDFLWSNCALGHLGSIPEGLKFIEDSLKCLKPDGWAVHTTELNILSDDETVTGGSTVVFRLSDVYKLQKQLVSQGYEVSPFLLTLGNDPMDKRVSMAPVFGNDHSKIQVMGHLATQIVLIIHKPGKAPVNATRQQLSRLALRRAFIQNKLKMHRYRTTNPTIRQILKSQGAPIKSIKATPVKEVVNTKVHKGKTADVLLEYRNDSEIPLFSTYNRLADSRPIVLATTDPHDRASKFYHASWPGKDKNRSTFDLWIKSPKGVWELADYVLPKQDFAFRITLDAHNLPRGTYLERFCIVQENVGWLDSSTVTASVKVG